MYADDSTIHISGKNISDIQTKVQEDLNRIELWCKDDNMFINCNKTKCMTVGTKQKLAFQNEELFLTINSEQLQHSTCEKLLGIKIDSNLNWKNQIDKICSIISPNIYHLSKNKKYLNLELRQLFNWGSVIRIKILIMGHFLLTLRISMGHSLIFFVNISDFNGTLSDGM
jgi:hypothetical protein